MEVPMLRRRAGRPLQLIPNDACEESARSQKTSKTEMGTKILPEGHSFTHEWASAMLFDAILDENPDIIIKKGSKEAKFIRCLIEGKPEECPEEKRFLFDIVNNSRNSVDVDKIDYI